MKRGSVLSDRYEKYSILKCFEKNIKKENEKICEECVHNGVRVYNLFRLYAKSLWVLDDSVNVNNFLMDMSLNSCINLYLISGFDGMLTYIKDLPGMDEELIDNIIMDRKEIVEFNKTCKKNNLILKDVYYAEIKKDVDNLFLLGGVDIHKIRRIFSNKEGKYLSYEFFNSLAYRNHQVLEMMLVSGIDNFKIDVLNGKILFLSPKSLLFFNENKERKSGSWL